MREIEFRGKRLFDNKWFYGYLFIWYDVNGKEFYDLLDKKEEVIVNHIGQTYPAMYEIKKETLGQYTGLKDKNGKKIFEGDIVKAFYFEKEVIGKIEFIYGTFALTNSGISDNQLFIFEKLEVIGNIYDNPELFKEE